MLFFAIAAKLPRKDSDPTNNKQHSIAVLIPAYKEDKVIIDVAKEASEHNYPSFNVFILADSLKEETITKQQYDISVIIVDFEKSTKAKSLTLAVLLINMILRSY